MGNDPTVQFPHLVATTADSNEIIQILKILGRPAGSDVTPLLVLQLPNQDREVVSKAVHDLKGALRTFRNLIASFEDQDSFSDESRQAILLRAKDAATTLGAASAFLQVLLSIKST